MDRLAAAGLRQNGYMTAWIGWPDAFGRLVAARAKLREAIPADQWDAIVGAATKPKP